jgi:hypothetical protein
LLLLRIASVVVVALALADVAASVTAASIIASPPTLAS